MKNIDSSNKRNKMIDSKGIQATRKKIKFKLWYTRTTFEYFSLY